MSVEYLLADRNYDTSTMVEQAQDQSMETAIPPKKNRTEQRGYDEDLYKGRHLVKNAFPHMKR